jgi:hypothetical protein
MLIMKKNQTVERSGWLILLLAILVISSCREKEDQPDPPISIFPDNETGLYQDMLTPLYYKSDESDEFRLQVNKFIHYARKEIFHHPLENDNGQIPNITVPEMGKFGAKKGNGDFAQHHAADDLHFENNTTAINLYAVHDGIVNTYRDAEKYRHYASITKSIKNEEGNILGTMVTIYAHIDLDLDEASGIIMDGQEIQKGEIISKHLYDETVGGPHLHFEVRYYRPSDSGIETFYQFVGPQGSSIYTVPSAGKWTYGYWIPDIGYGFAHPANHGLIFY